MLGGNLNQMAGPDADTLPPGMRLRERERQKIRTILGKNRVSIKKLNIIFGEKLKCDLYQRKWL